MPNSCLTSVGNDLLIDCDNLDITGLEESVVMINYGNIELITFDEANPKIITAIDLVAGATGYRLDGVKQLNSLLNEVVVSDDALNKWRHSFVGQVRNLTAATRLEMDNIAGGRFLVVVEKRWKGNGNESAFIVLGVQRGLELTTGTENSAENEGVFTFTLSSLDSALESSGAPIFFDTDYATSLQVFNNSFAA